MRALSVVILTLLCTYVSYAQKTINKTVNTQAGQEVNFNFDRANVKFTTWNKNEISITGTASVNLDENNDAFTMEIKERGGEWNISTFLKNECDLPKIITMSKDGQTTYKKINKKKNKNARNGWDNLTADGDSYDYVSIGIIAEIELEVKIPQNIVMNIKSRFGNIDIKDFEGALYVKNTHGHINAIFSKPIKQDVKLSSTHDFVDVSVPSNSKLDIDLKSSHGEILTDLDLDFEKGNSGRNSKRNSCNSKNKVVANMNGGGNELTLNSTHNKIYLREYKVNN